jgi:hypothetical protein
MGGTVHVYIRMPSGEFFRMCRWTNSLGLLENAIIRPDIQTELDNYMKEWYKMREDYTQNKRSRRFVYPMTDMYFPSPTDINYGQYGAVFVDFVTKKLISYNDYCTFFVWYCAKFRLEAKMDEEDRDHWHNAKYAVHHADVWKHDWQKDVSEPVNDLLAFLETWTMASDEDLYVHPHGWMFEQGTKDGCKSREFKRKVKEVLEST